MNFDHFWEEGKNHNFTFGPQFPRIFVYFVVTAAQIDKQRRKMNGKSWLTTSLRLFRPGPRRLRPAAAHPIGFGINENVRPCWILYRSHLASAGLATWNIP